MRALKLVTQRLVEREDEKLDALCERLHKAAEARDEFAASPDAGRIEPGHRSSARSIRGVDR